MPDGKRRGRAGRPGAGPLVRATALLALGGACTEGASWFLQWRYPDRPVAPDLLLDALPYIEPARLLTSAAIFAAVVLFAIHAWRHEPQRIPDFVAMLAVMYLMRSVLLVLTPLANARDGLPAQFPLFQYGMFPSGHTAVVVLCAMWVDRRTAPGVKRVAVSLALVVCLGLLLAHSHYAIDIAGGALLAYFVDREWRQGWLLEPVKRLVMAE
jgi:membrane-associated phospholipid phosphatase